MNYKLTVAAAVAKSRDCHFYVSMCLCNIDDDNDDRTAGEVK